MKKKIIGIFVCMLLIATVLPVSGNVGVESNSDFDIDYQSWYFGKLWFDVENVGDVDAVNVSWRIGIDYISINPPIWTGVIENLSVGEVERISSDWFIFAPLGIHDITVELNATNTEEYTRITRGLFLGPFIWIPKFLHLHKNHNWRKEE